MGTVGISAITLAELQFGVARSSDPARNTIALAHFCAPLEVWAFDDEAASVYGRIRASVARTGKPVGPLDMLSASHAVALHAAVVMNNEREFSRVPGLRVKDWLHR